MGLGCVEQHLPAQTRRLAALPVYWRFGVLAVQLKRRDAASTIAGRIGRLSPRCLLAEDCGRILSWPIAAAAAFFAVSCEKTASFASVDFPEFRLAPARGIV
jgi:hypothetical protein